MLPPWVRRATRTWMGPGGRGAPCPPWFLQAPNTRPGAEGGACPQIPFIQRSERYTHCQEKQNLASRVADS